MRILLTLPLLFSLASGCALNRTPLFDEDVGAAPDVPGLDAPLPDVPGLDAPLSDVPGLDAPALDAPGDAPDAPTLPDAGGCVPTTTTAVEESCDRVDDDCDGVIDDDDVCGCDAITVGGRAYLSCPGPLSGLDAWRGACGKTAPGYDLVSFGSGAEQSGVLAALATRGITDPHWIGLNDFDENGTYVWRDRSTTFAPEAIGGDDPAKRFVILRPDGSYEELTGTDTRRYLCEASVPAGACRAGTESPTCNGIDDDCNGAADDGLDCGAGCTASLFWDSVYYVCEDERSHRAARDHCGSVGASLVVLSSETERGMLGGTASSEVWLGLTQAMSSPSTFANWSWGAPGGSYGIPTGRGMAPWDGGSGGQPDDVMPPETNVENCASMRTDDDFEDNACGDAYDFVCERTWSY